MCLYRMAEECLTGYKTTLEEEEEILKSQQLTARQKYCVHVRYGQLKLLHKLIDACSTSNGNDIDTTTANTTDSKQPEIERETPTENNTHVQSTGNQ